MWVNMLNKLIRKKEEGGGGGGIKLTRETKIALTKE